jgi:hypothetical protein
MDADPDSLYGDVPCPRLLVSERTSGEVGEVVGVPEEWDPDTVYIVSLVVATRLRQARLDNGHIVCLIVPGTGPTDGAERDSTGRVTAVTRFLRIR